MASQRRQRLEKLVLLMQRLKSFHEAQHAGHLATATAADSETGEIVARLDAGDAMAALFPELYHRRVAHALQRSRESSARAQAEARNIMTADARSNALARAYREATNLEERDQADKDRLEFIERGVAPKA